MTGDILHEDGDFRLVTLQSNSKLSFITHMCSKYPPPAKAIWWFLPTPHKCYMCGAAPSNDIRGLYTLHNWDSLQGVK